MCRKRTLVIELSKADVERIHLGDEHNCIVDNIKIIIRLPNEDVMPGVKQIVLYEKNTQKKT
jgi:hypothetical protein